MFKKASVSERGLPLMTSTLRGEGVPSKADIESYLSKGGCVNLRTRGGGKNFLRTSYVYNPLPNCPTRSDKLPTAQVESARQWNTKNPSQYNPGARVDGTPSIGKGILVILPGDAS